MAKNIAGAPGRNGLAEESHLRETGHVPECEGCGDVLCSWRAPEKSPRRR